MRTLEVTVRGPTTQSRAATVRAREESRRAFYLRMMVSPLRKPPRSRRWLEAGPVNKSLASVGPGQP